MDIDSDTPHFQELKKRLELYFPEKVYSEEAIETDLESGDIFYETTAVLPYIQTALLDDKILEVELDGMEGLYFGRLYDDLPSFEEEREEPYEPGDYLKQMTHLISLPLEPGMGNLHIRHAKKIVIRIFTSSLAVELGTYYEDMCLVRDLPVLRLAYPVVGRLVHGMREFRARPGSEMNLQVMVMGKRKHGTIKTQIVDISSRGMSFAIKKKEQSYFRVDEMRTFEFVVEGIMTLRVKGRVRHVSKVRGRSGTEFLCGVEFDLVTRALAAEVGSLVATVQRSHLKELAQKSRDSGLNLIL